MNSKFYREYFSENRTNIITDLNNKITNDLLEGAMAIPKYHMLYNVFLEALRDQQEHTLKDLKQFAIEQFNISDEDLAVLLPSGKQAMFDNTIGWTRTYLKKAGLIESPQRAVFTITHEGLKLLNQGIAINDNVLMQFESFRQFKRNSEIKEVVVTTNEIEDETPQYTLERAFKTINESIAEDLLSEIMKQSPIFFENLVVLLLEKMGYGGSIAGAGQVTKKSGDEGIDGVIREDKLGFSQIYIQAKRWELKSTIGRPEIQKFVGALAGQGGGRGLFITTAQFTKEAIEFTKKQLSTKVVLVDGRQLAQLMIEYNVGVSTESVYEVKRIDTDFFIGGY